MLKNECIRHDVIKEVLFKLSVAIALAKVSKIIWEKVSQESTGARLGGRQARRGKTPPPWNRKVKQKKIDPELWEEVSNRRAWTLRHRFYKCTPGRLGLVC